MQINVGQNSYHVSVYGAGQPYWLFLHGFMGSGQDFAPIARHIKGTALLPDLLGHGQSGKPTQAESYAMARQAVDLKNILQQLQVEQPLRLVGYSMGGRLALYFSWRYPQLVQQLILESSTAGLATAKEREKRQRQDQAKARFLQTRPLAEFVAHWEQLPLFASQKTLPSQLQEQVRQQRLSQEPQALAASLLGMGTGVMPNLWPYLAQISLPVMLITGQEDRKFQGIMRQMAARLPQAQLHVIAQAGHNVHLEQPQSYCRLLKEFLPCV
ncbi:2-succinyl-6-hydroxy-2,4-cyclohexadiene-1-carboxylate synthase [Bifidobacterium sp. ESL0798]|uniref:2-succinyl-6-hydroxy-2, 4-cyclohexadiene-1-carboxylate synthase n=1 Tax=Bifidobacterium sp. ESL0798 TaxID=2983235 RepID=UPI0023F62C53|nr:2-succinyl-6-hydroxy-2,4-cyclohexadiene-1-carboxylate synthase [Bifidobacterium sp. ESL0798]WEV74756.1 2-succinyl-6-hydroxy-2,4-cyclohexadiene-1-carboxylate synthase [Bifidobacterium sp. ESL0798]